MFGASGRTTVGGSCGVRCGTPSGGGGGFETSCDVCAEKEGSTIIKGEHFEFQIMLFLCTILSSYTSVVIDTCNKKDNL